MFCSSTLSSILFMEDLYEIIYEEKKSYRKILLIGDYAELK